MHIWMCCFFAFISTSVIADDGFDFDDDAGQVDTLVPVFDLQLRRDRVRDLPRPVDPDFDRLLLRVHLGYDWMPGNAWRMRTTGRLHAANDDNDTVAFNLDNSRLRDAAVDETWLDYQGDAFGFRLGQMRLLPELSPAIWDDNLRLRGATLQLADRLAHPAQRLLLGGGVIDHALGSDAEMLLVQWQQRYGLGSGAVSVNLAGIAFDELDTLAGARRTNTVTDGVLANEFRIASFDTGYATTVGSKPFRFGISLARNLEATNQADMGRLDLVLGNARLQNGFEFGLAVQRVQADAVPAALNDADWWFPTRMRGQRLWLARNCGSGWMARLALFRERVDPRDDYMHRLLFDLTYRF